MGFPTNSSPYGVNRMQYPASPQGGGNQGGGSSSGGFDAFSYLSPAYGLYKNRDQEGSLGQILFGRPERNYQQSLLGPEQQQAYQQLLQAGQGPGAGGAFGESADYYRNNLSNNSADFNAFAAPEMRRFNEQIVPGLAEQFAGMGSGGLSSSGFRNAAVSAGTDLSERLAAIRAQLRQQSAQGLSDIGSRGLQQFSENIHSPETYGLVGSGVEGFSKGLGNAAGVAAFG